MKSSNMPTTPQPLLSAAQLAQRWGCHPSTITRRVAQGFIRPAARSGAQMRFALTDVEAVEAGAGPEVHGLDAPRRAALKAVLELLGLERAHLTLGECEALCGTFHSMPHDERRDGSLIAGQLEIIERAVRAISRAEVFEVIRSAPTLREMVTDLQELVNGLTPKADAGGAAQA
jgi:hypothetical protein